MPSTECATMIVAHDSIDPQKALRDPRSNTECATIHKNETLGTRVRSKIRRIVAHSMDPQNALRDPPIAQIDRTRLRGGVPGVSAGIGEIGFS